MEKKIFKNLEQQIDTNQTWYNTQDIIESNKEVDNKKKRKRKLMKRIELNPVYIFPSETKKKELRGSISIQLDPLIIIFFISMNNV